MKSELIDYQLHEQIFRGYLVHDGKPGKHPGVLVVHEAWGLGEHTKKRANRLAELGYVAFGVDMYGEGKTVTDTAEGLQRTRALRADVDKLRAIIGAAFDTLIARPEVDAGRIASIGFCFGGTSSIELARSGAKFAGVVSFHGGLETTKPAGPGEVKAKILVCTGAEDPFIPITQVDGFIKEMGLAGADLQVVIYGGAKHSFTEPAASARGIDGLAYNEAADRRSWQAMMDFFREIFA